MATIHTHLSVDSCYSGLRMADMVIRIGLVQMRCEKGAVAQNLKGISRYLGEGVAREVDILSLPEMSITGYADPIQYPEAVVRLDGPEVAKLLEMTRGYSISVLAGLIEENPSGRPFITQIVVRNGQMLGYYRKRTIKDEEAEWFSAGEQVPVFTHDDLTFGIAICADIGSEEVFAACSQQGAEIVFELAAPGLYGEQETRNWRSGFEWWEGECNKYLSKYANTYDLWIGVATQAGRTIDEDFPGGGYVFAPGGQRVYATEDGSPGAVYLEIDSVAGQVVEL